MTTSVHPRTLAVLVDRISARLAAIIGELDQLGQVALNSDHADLAGALNAATVHLDVTRQAAGAVLGALGLSATPRDRTPDAQPATAAAFIQAIARTSSRISDVMADLATLDNLDDPRIPYLRANLAGHALHIETVKRALDTMTYAIDAWTHDQPTTPQHEQQQLHYQESTT